MLCSGQGSAADSGLDHQRAEAEAADNPVAAREIFTARRSAGGKLGNQRTIGDDACSQFAVLRGVDSIQSGGGTVLWTRIRAGEPPLIVLVQQPDADNPNRLLVGRADPRYIWAGGADTLPRHTVPINKFRRGASAPKRVIFCMAQPALVVSMDRIIVSAMSGDRMKKKRSYPGEAMNPVFHALACGESGGPCGIDEC